MNRTLALEEFFANLDRCEDKSSSTHGVHPYPAKFIPHIPREIIKHYSQPGDTVLDSMCGSGTTVLEAMMAGRRGLGTDINPISVLVTQVKVTPVSGAAELEVAEFLSRLSREGDAVSGEPPEFHNIWHWFSRDVAEALAGLLSRIDALSTPEAAALARVSLSAIIVAVSRQDSETRWVRTDREVTSSDVVRRFQQKLTNNLARARALDAGRGPRPFVAASDARALPVRNESVDLIVTSPPYANSHDYYLYNKLRLFWLGYDVSPVQSAEFGSRNKHSDQKQDIDHYLSAMRGCLTEMSRVLRQGGHACVVVGDAVVRGEFFDMGVELTALAKAVGFDLESHHKFSQQRYTRAFTRGFGTGMSKATHVLIFGR